MGHDYEALDLGALEKEAQRLTEESTSGAGSNDYLEKFVKLPEKDGFTVLRILPRKRGTKNPWCVTRVHTLINPRNNQRRTYHCPKELGLNAKGKEQWQGDCIICKYYNDLWQKSDQTSGKAQEDLRNQARAIKPVERYYYNVIVRSETGKDGKNYKNVGPKIYSCGKTVHEKIIRAIRGDASLGEKPLGDITHPKEGRDFKVVKKVVKGGGGAEYPNYDNSKFEDPTPAGNPDEFGKWIDTMHDLQSLRVVKTPEELKHALRVHLGMVVEDAGGGNNSDLDEFRNAGRPPQAAAPAPEAKPERIRENLAVSTSSASESRQSPSDDGMADDDFMKELEGI